MILYPVRELTLSQCQVRLHVKVLRRDINIFLEWRNGDMSGEQMKSVAHIFEQMLAKVLSTETTAISQLNLFSENDWQRIRSWNSHTPTLYDTCIHDAIREQAINGPDREAVCAWDGRLTFGELDELASRVACHLRMQGVGPEVRVALCFDKSVSLPIFAFDCRGEVLCADVARNGISWPCLA